MSFKNCSVKDIAGMLKCQHSLYEHNMPEILTDIPGHNPFSEGVYLCRMEIDDGNCGMLI